MFILIPQFAVSHAWCLLFCRSLECELAVLIAKGEIKARIDLKAGALVANKPDVRGSTFNAAVDAAESYIRSMRGLLLRSAMMRHDMVQRPHQVRGDRQEGPRSGGPQRGEREGGNRRRRDQRDRAAQDLLQLMDDAAGGSSGSLDLGRMEALGGQEESGSMLAD